VGLILPFLLINCVAASDAVAGKAVVVEQDGAPGQIATEVSQWWCHCGIILQLEVYPCE
jgi:hypothetical protein